MSKKSFKALLITSIIFAVAGVACFIVKLVELTMRTEHEWAKTFVILGFVFLAVALLILVGAVAAENLIENRQAKNPKLSDEELLAKYKTKK